MNDKTPAQEVAYSEKEITKTKWISRVGYVVLVAALVGIGTIAYWLNQPDKVLEIKNQPIPIRTIRPEAHPDGVVILKYSYCKNYDVEGRIRTSFVNDKVEIFLPAATDRTEKICRDDIEVPYVVPPQLTPGKYKMHFRATYKINPLKEAVIEWDSQEFDVAE